MWDNGDSHVYAELQELSSACLECGGEELEDGG